MLSQVWDKLGQQLGSWVCSQGAGTYRVLQSHGSWSVFSRETYFYSPPHTHFQYAWELGVIRWIPRQAARQDEKNGSQSSYVVLETARTEVIGERPKQLKSVYYMDTSTVN